MQRSCHAVRFVKLKQAIVPGCLLASLLCSASSHAQSTDSSTSNLPATPAETAAVAAVAAASDTSTASSLGEMFTKGSVSGDFRTIYFGSRNAFFSNGLNQDTVSYGGKLGFTSGQYDGFSFGVSGFIQRGIDHSTDASKVDGYLGPNLLAMGEAYLQWQRDNWRVTAGNQQLDVPFASTYDWRMAPQLFQGLDVKYGDADNYLTAFKMYRYKSYISNSFVKGTTYNTAVDSYSTIGDAETNGFWGIGGGKKVPLDNVVLTGQAWYQAYQDYADLLYAEGQVARKEGEIRPFVGAQVFHETGDGRQLLGPITSQVYGLQLGAKRNSVTLSFGYDRVVPHADSYLNGALVTPYAHNVSSGPLFAQPFLTSTQDLGAGNAYAIDLNGSPANGWFIGTRYSYMDLKSSSTAHSLNQSEYLLYAIYNFSGQLKGLSIANFVGLQSSPSYSSKFLQERLTIEYAWGGK